MHMVHVLTDPPPNTGFLKLGPMMKCIVKLGEHGIEYHPRKMIEGKNLVNYLAKITTIPNVFKYDGEKVRKETSLSQRAGKCKCTEPLVVKRVGWEY